MAQRIFEPFRKLPHQLQNLDFVKRLHDYTLGKHTDSYCCYQSSAYGCLESPSCLAFDDILGLLAIGTSKGLLKIYGSPGVVFTVQREGPPITSVLFLPGEGRIVCASIDGALHLFELDSSCGRWSLCSHIRVQQNVEQDRITCLCLGHGIIYIGSGNGTLRQVAVKNGHMTLGDDTLTACTSSIISESVPADKRDQLGVDSPIVSLELQPQGNHLLIAYAGGCVAVAVPQTVPSGSVTQPAVSVDGVTAPTAEGEVVTPSVDELAPTITQETQGEAVPSDKGETAGETTQSILNDSAVESTPSTPAKGHSDKRSTLKFKALTRSLRPDTPKLEEQVEPSLPVPPAPRISHLLLRDQPVEWASWRVSTIDSLSTEVVVAYGDGAFQVWPIVAAVSDQLFEPIIVSMIDPPNTPYDETVPGNFMTKPSAPSHSATLLVLTERELVAVDLTQPDWPAYDSPYLNCMDFSPVTAITHIGQVPSALIQRLHQAAHTTTDDITNCSWPIWGGSQADGNKKNLAQNAGNDIIALGHSNGWVTLWAIGRGDTTIHLGTLPTSSLFNSADLQNDQKCGSSALGEETWPPFRPVGYCSRAQRHTLEGCDPRLAISQLLILLGSPIRSGVSDSVAPDTLTLVVGGASGQVSLWVAGSEGFLHTPELTSFEPDVSRVYINLIDQSEEDKYIWKDAPCLRPTEGVPQYCTPTGLTFHPSHLVQLNPPSQITSLALELSWNLLAVGSSHGFALLDLFNRSIIHTHFTYDSSGPAKIFNTVSTVQNVIMARGKQIKSNIRHSFRRLKNLRTSTTTTERSETKEKDQPVEVDEKIEAQEGIDIVEVTDQPIASESTEEQKPQLMTDNAENSCIESDEATEQKESTKPSETPAEVTTESVKDTEIPMQSTQSTQDIHQLLLCSEEKVKLFSLPSLRAIYDHKFVDRLRMLGMSLTSGTGSTSKPEKDVNEEADAAVGESETAYVNASQVNRKRVTGFGLQNFTSGSGENTKLEWNAVATLLDGQIAVLSLPSLRKVFKERCYPGYLPSTLPYVATRTFNTHIFWFIGCRLLVSELTPIPSLNSFAVPVNNVITDDFVAIRLPDWARIKKDAPVEDDILKVTQTASVDESPQIAGNFATDETKIDFIPVVEEEIIPTAKKVNDITLENGQNVGDVTLDSIKEYLNGTDVTLVVKTTELSTEKRTLVEGGKITTTVHEVEKIDGKVTKDDIVKFVTDGEPEITVGITGTA
ncbi:Syntaxin-binding protein 5-like [Schistosoma japonicum]|nr:Syntaxin-binding protein 5-like [Schistosoma japonicum]